VTTRLLPPGGGSPRETALAVNLALQGKVTSFGTVTLATSATSTTVTNQLVGDNSVILLFPQTANAAAEIGNGTIYAKPADYAVGASFKLTHANNSQADRTFGYVILG